MPMATSAKKRALFYLPHAFIWPHAFPEALVAEALQSQGIEIHHVGCSKDFSSHCISMDSESLSEESSPEKKEKICDLCIKKKQLLRGHFKFDYSDISNYVTKEDLKQIAIWLDEVKPDNILDFEIDGFPVGKSSLYDFTLIRKKFRTDKFSEAEWSAFKKRLKSVLTSYCAGKKILEEMKPDYIFFSNSIYSCNVVFLQQALKLNIPCFSLYGGNNWANVVQRIHISSKQNFAAMDSRLALWFEKFSQRPATIDALESAESFQKTLFAGETAMIYGGGSNRHNWRELKKTWGISDQQKVLFLATSSYDELLSGQMIGYYPKELNLIFETQVDWIKETISFVEKRKDLFLVIRVHPRELPNKRDKNISEHSLILEELLKGKLPENVKVNWPGDNLSLYDWFELIDLGLISWSSVGKEMGLWGIPNLTYTERVCYYPARETGSVAIDKTDYFKKIDQILKEGWKEDRLNTSYRWLAYEMEGATFDISDGVPNRMTKPRTLGMRAIRKLLDPLFEERLSLVFHRKAVKAAPLIWERVTTDLPTEDILEPHRHRMTAEDELKKIKSVVVEAANALWGQDWQTSKDPSPLRKNILKMLR
jgi:hypothetical protein